MAQPTLAMGLDSVLGFLSLMFERLPAQLVHQQSLAEIVLLEDEHEPRRAFTYFTYWIFWIQHSFWYIRSVQSSIGEKFFKEI